MSAVDLHLDDVLDWAAGYTGPKFHALLCDAPYELSFMGKQWDGTGISFQPATWKALAAHLLPGAFGMTFAGSRTFHRMAVAIEDAGLIIHPMLGWIYGSGFPKATRIDTQVDKAAGAEREVVGANPNHRPISGVNYEGIYAGGNTGASDLTAPATPLAATWAGHRYGLQALKPALEPVIVWQKPYQGRPVDSITRTGAGALNVDGGRIAANDSTWTHVKTKTGTFSQEQRPWKDALTGNEYESGGAAGRWPSNLLLSHLPGCNGTCEPGCPVAALGEQSGTSRSDGGTGETTQSIGGRGAYRGGDNRGFFHYGDTGTAARFFFQAEYNLEAADPFFYCAKSSRRERDSGLDGEKKPLLWSSGTKNPGSFQSPNTERAARNNHPCVKPLSLARYLATLLLPPAEYAPRRILVPFAGSGSEAIGAALAGWEEVTGIERESEYLEIARARVDHWTKQAAQMVMEI